VEDVPAAVAVETVSGMPFVRNSTATSGFPFAARRQAMTISSGNPIEVRLERTSAGNSLFEVAGEGAEEDEEVSVFVLSVAEVVVAGAGAGISADGAGGGAGGVGEAVFFFALLTITTRKSFGLILHFSKVSSSFNIFPE